MRECWQWKNGYDSAFRDLNAGDLFTVVDLDGAAGIDWGDEYVQPPGNHDAFELGGAAEVSDLSLGLEVAANDRPQFDRTRRLLYKWVNPRFCDPAHPGTLRRISQGGLIRDHYCRPVGKPKFRETVDDYNTVKGILNFRFYDPVWFNPTARSVAVNQASMGGGLIFDDEGHTVPAPTSEFTTADGLIFAASEIHLTIGQAEGLIAYGDWPAYPNIVLTGPGSEFEVESLTTGQRIRLSGYTLAAGETATFNLQPGHKSVISSVNGSVVGYVPRADDLSTFYLEVDPIAAGGVNQWSLTLLGIDADTEIAISWNDRYTHY
jgi:hypothetical protein